MACFLLLGVALAVGAGRAQDLKLDGYSRRVWGSQDGLPDQTVQAFAQTPDGSLWIGTKGGLLRFDGMRFEEYGRDTAPEVLEHGINCLLAGRDGSLWIGTEGGGLIRYRLHRFERFATAGNVNNQVVRAIFEDAGGTLWVGADQGLFRLEGRSLVRVDDTPAIPAIFVRSIVQDRGGRVWVGGTRLYEFDSGRFVRELGLPSRQQTPLILAMDVGADETLWIGMLSGMYRLQRGGSVEEAAPLQAPVNVVRSRGRGELWIGTVGQGLYVLRDGKLGHATEPNLPGKTVRAILEDREGDIWLGTQAGVMRLSKSPVSIVSLPSGEDAQFETLYADRDGSVWVATSTRLFRIRDGEVRPYEFAVLPRLRVRTLFRDHKGGYWIGTDGEGLFHIDGARRESFRLEHGLSNNFVRTILESRDGSMWVGTDGGLTHISANGSQNYDTTNGLAYFSVTCLYEDRSGGIWAGTSRGVTHIVKGAVVRDATTRAMANEQLWSIVQDDAGTTWFGTSSGLYGLKDGRVVHITTQQGLASDIVYQVLPDAKGSVWVTGPNSVSRLRQRELDNFAAGGRVEMTLHLDPYDLESASMYSGMQPEGAVAPNGEIWLASNKGALTIDPRKVVPSTSTPVEIEQVLVDGQPVDAGQVIRLKPGNGRLEISYGAIHLRSQGGVRYRYRMEGLDAWNEAQTRRTAYYTHLPAGTYRFTVQATELDQPGAVSERSITVIQEPYFYKTTWFLVLCGIVLGGLVIAIYRLRLQQMRLRFQAVSDERARLAREMHDTVIQGCVGASTLLEAALGIDGAADEPLKQQLVSYANDQMRSTIDLAREAVWALRNSSSSEAHVGILCGEIAQKMAPDADVPIRCRVTGTPYALSELATHELMMAVREAVLNAVSHADAQEIEVRVSFEEDGLAVDICDDGRGFDVKTKSAGTGHYGLVGMKERIQLIHGTLRIESADGAGTTVRITLPRAHRRIEPVKTGS